MPKINVKVTVTTPEERIENKYKAIFYPESREIIYQEEDGTKTKVNLVKAKLRRDNSKLEMEYFFDLKKKTEGTIYVKELQKKLMVKISTKKLKITNDSMEIQYKVEKEDYKYNLEVIK